MFMFSGYIVLQRSEINEQYSNKTKIYFRSNNFFAKVVNSFGNEINLQNFK